MCTRTQPGKSEPTDALDRNECRQRGDWKHAIENYNEAIELDPQSPAVEAKQMVENILDFYCKDIYNP